MLLKALPAGLTDFFAVSALVICGHVFNIPSTDIATASTLLIAVVGFMIMIKISHPFNKFKYGILALNIFGLIFCGLFLDSLFAMSDMSNICILLTIVFGFAAESMFRYITIFVEFIQNRMRNKKMLYDKDIREPLFMYFEEKYGKTRVFEEKRMGNSRADILIITEKILSASK